MSTVNKPVTQAELKPAGGCFDCSNVGIVCCTEITAVLLFPGGGFIRALRGVYRVSVSEKLFSPNMTMHSVHSGAHTAADRVDETGKLLDRSNT